jgi:cytochrome c553
MFPGHQLKADIQEVDMKDRLSHPLVVLCMAGVFSGFGSGPAAAAGDAAAGAAKAIFCAYCHGSDGNPLDKAAPRLAGQDADVLVAKMKLQTEALGPHELMIQAWRTARALNDQDMNDLAAYFSQQPVREPLQTASPQPPGK